MKLQNLTAVYMFIAALPVGCVQKSVPTVEYFRTHRDERVAEIRRCTNEIGKLKGDPLCVNATEAERLESLGRLRDLPPLGLPPVTQPPQNEKQEREKQD